MAHIVILLAGGLVAAIGVPIAKDWRGFGTRYARFYVESAVTDRGRRRREEREDFMRRWPGLFLILTGLALFWASTRMPS
jgi:hypothetical protein